MAHFLRDLGLRAPIPGGFLSRERIREMAINPDFFRALARLDRSYHREEIVGELGDDWRLDHFVSAHEVRRGRQILEAVGGGVTLRRLTAQTSCWSRDLVGFFRNQVLRDKRFLLDRSGSLLPGRPVGVVSRCPYDERVPHLMEGIFFEVSQMPPLVQRAAQGVHPVSWRDGVERVRGGSVIQVTAEGGFLSMPHVTHQVADRCERIVQNRTLCRLRGLHPGLVVQKPRREIRIGADSIVQAPEGVFHDPWWEDVVSHWIAGAADQAFVPLSEVAPSVGDLVFVIGFPGLGMRGSRKLVSVGRINRIEKGEIEATAQARSGSSGGAMVDRSGRLIGVVASLPSRDVPRYENMTPAGHLPVSFTGVVAISVVERREEILRRLRDRAAQR